jgi:hypothetical protein
VEIDFVEVTDLVEVPSPRLEEAYEDVQDALEGEVPKLVEALQELGRALIAEGGEVLREFLGSALELLEQSGVLEALRDAIEAHTAIAEALAQGLEAIAELPLEELIRLLGMVAIALNDPELFEDEELMRLLLRSYQALG